MDHILSTNLDPFSTDLDRISGHNGAPAHNAPLTFRLLRHHTKNALQRILAQCENVNLRATREGAALSDEIQRRIMLSVNISDALFGMTTAPANFEDRIKTLVNCTVSMLCDPSQKIRTETEIIGQCPRPLATLVLQVTHELVGNAVIHGMYRRSIGRIHVSLRVSSNARLHLAVEDDGWGPKDAVPGEGSVILTELVRGYRGSISLTRRGTLTTAIMSIPAQVEVAGQVRRLIDFERNEPV